MPGNPWFTVPTVNRFLHHHNCFAQSIDSKIWDEIHIMIEPTILQRFLLLKITSLPQEVGLKQDLKNDKEPTFYQTQMGFGFPPVVFFKF